MTEDVASKSGGMNVITLLHAGSVRRTRRQMDDSSLHVQVVDIAKLLIHLHTHQVATPGSLRNAACMHACKRHSQVVDPRRIKWRLDRSIDRSMLHELSTSSR